MADDLDQELTAEDCERIAMLRMAFLTGLQGTRADIGVIALLDAVHTIVQLYGTPQFTEFAVGHLELCSSAIAAEGSIAASTAPTLH